MDNLTEQITENELFERWRCVVDKGQAPIRIDKYLAVHMAGTSCMGKQ